MEELLRLHAEHGAVSPEVEAAWLHHRFTQIHPFQDGNGRVARWLASLVLIRAGWFPLIVSDTRGERDDYLGALAGADRGDLAPLVDLFAALQRRAFLLALRDVPQSREVEPIIGAVKEFLRERESERPAELRHAVETAAHLQAVAGQRFRNIAARLTHEIEPLSKGALFINAEAPHGSTQDNTYRQQIVDTARQLGYDADLSSYRAWTDLYLVTKPPTRIVLSYHGIGPEFRGKLAVSACFFRSDPETIITNLTPLCSDIFSIDSLEPQEEAERRFRPWLEEVLVAGLELWRLGL